MAKHRDVAFDSKGLVLDPADRAEAAADGGRGS